MAAGCPLLHADRFFLPVVITPPAASQFPVDRGRSAFRVFLQFDGVADHRVVLAVMGSKVPDLGPARIETDAEIQVEPRGQNAFVPDPVIFLPARLEFHQLLLLRD